MRFYRNYLHANLDADCCLETLRVQSLVTPRKHVDDRILDEGAEDEDETGRHPDVDGLREGDGWEATLPGALGRNRQHGKDAERDASRYRLEVDPEGDPRQENDEHARKVCRQDVGAQTTFQVEISSNAWKRSYDGKH